MKSVQKIWAELSVKEVELSEEQKVELSSIAEIKQIQGKMNNLNGSSNTINLRMGGLCNIMVET